MRALVLASVILVSGWFCDHSRLPFIPLFGEVEVDDHDLDIRDEQVKKLFSHLEPTPGKSALLLGFDTDESGDSDSYAQYYDDFEKLSEKKPTNRTRLFVREGEKVEVAAELDFIASPQTKGWLFLGQARYFEPKPRDKNEHLDGLEQKGDLKNFGFDYSRIWVAADASKIISATESLIRKTKSEIDKEYKKLNRDEREYHRNITDYEKIGWISDGYFIEDGYWSLVHGGAAWFEARENSRLVSLAGQLFSGDLDKWYSRKEIVDRYAEYFKIDYQDCSGLKSNNSNCVWNKWRTNLSRNHADEMPTFTIERRSARTRLIGRVLVDGNTHRSFLQTADFGPAPSKLAKYDNPDLDFKEAELLFPTLIDVFISPNQDTAFFLTAKEMIAIDTTSGKEIYRRNHGLSFNKVIMVEWAVGPHVERWRKTLAESTGL